jgi:alpha-galactosidase
MGIEAYWLDAGWFEGGWPNGVGNWVPDKKKFPRGLKVLGDAARKNGIGFVLWLEPERVDPASRIANEHPEWVLHADGQRDGLFNLGDPEARVWLTDYLSRCISEWGVTILRQDFNIEPLPFWRAADAPGRQGITEIRYIEGLYALWDELRQRHPNLDIDNCASGGRRIDLETMSRSFPLWRSDTQCAGKPFPVWDQVQTAGLSLYVPLHTAGVMGFDPYTYRSVATMGVVVTPDSTAPGFPVEAARRVIDEVKMLRPLWLGDYYPLTEIDLDERHWCGWQLNRPDLGKGFLALFRRPQSRYATLDVTLRGLDESAEYEVTFFDEEKRTVMTGLELQELQVEIDSPAKCVLILYHRAGAVDG